MAGKQGPRAPLKRKVNLLLEQGHLDRAIAAILDYQRTLADEAREPMPMPVRDWPIDMLDLAGATEEMLYRRGILTVGQLDCLTDKCLCKMEGIGETRMLEIREHVDMVRRWGEGGLAEGDD